jgi:hypothetical protein
MTNGYHFLTKCQDLTASRNSKDILRRPKRISRLGRYSIVESTDTTVIESYYWHRFSTGTTVHQNLKSRRLLPMRMGVSRIHCFWFFRVRIVTGWGRREHSLEPLASLPNPPTTGCHASTPTKFRAGILKTQHYQWLPATITGNSKVEFYWEGGKEVLCGTVAEKEDKLILSLVF